MRPLYTSKLKELEILAYQIRKDVIEMLTEAGSGHTAGSLGMADVFTALYFHILNHDPKKPSWADRDRLILSNGHICPVQYAAMAHAGYLPRKELLTLRRLDSRLQGHPHRRALPGIETTSGPLGSGLSQSCGIALAAKLDNKKYQTYCLTSDGEHQEGNYWEGVMFAAKYKLNNLTVIIDRNNIQIDGSTEDIMPLESLREKYQAFKWYVIEVDGHNINSIVDATQEALAIHDQPTVIIAHTIPGKGVDFMENRYEWHGLPPNKSDVPGAPDKNIQAEVALRELDRTEKKIKAERR